MTEIFSANRRSTVEIIHEILTLCRVDGCTPDKIKSHSQVSNSQLRRYLKALSTNALIRRETNGYYHLTDSGNQILNKLSRPVGTIRGVQQLLEGNGKLNANTATSVVGQQPQVPKSDLNMLTVSDVAHRLHVHPNSVRKWTNTGLIQCYRFGNRGDRRFRAQDVDEFMKSRGLRKQGQEVVPDDGPDSVVKPELKTPVT